MHNVEPGKVIAVIGSCMDETTGIVREKSMVLLHEINETGLVFSVKVLATDQANAAGIRSRVLTAIHNEFFKNNIRFPMKINI